MGQEMGMDSMAGGQGQSGLTPTGLDLSNEEDAMTFLDRILDGSKLQSIDASVARAFWYGVVIVIAIAATVNIIQIVRMRSRLRAAAKKVMYPTCPRNSFMRVMATVTAIIREATYPQVQLPGIPLWIRLPPVGTITMLLLYLGFVMGLEYYHNFILGAQHYQAFSLRAAWLTIAQLPLLILLSGKVNFIGLVSGVSYERLNILHRWVGRTVWLTATLHWAYQQYGWSLYGLASMERSADFCWPTGIASWSILTWILVSTVAPLRNLGYEFFVIQHVLAFFGFVVAIMIHIPVQYARIYVYIPIGLYLFDRLVRGLFFIYNNSRLGRATITALPGNVSKIRVRSSRLKSWKPGQHIHLTIPRFGIVQSHPATILSTPTSHAGDLVFILKAHKGFTSRIHRSATSSTTSLLPAKSKSLDPELHACDIHQTQHVALLAGPYGGSHSDFAAFDSTLLIAGSTGITYTLPIFLNIVARASKTPLPIHHLSFIWIVKSASWADWISEDLLAPVIALENAGIKCDINIYVTCDNTVTDPKITNGVSSTDNHSEKKNSGCKCTPNSAGTCCCTSDVTSSPIGEDFAPNNCTSRLPPRSPQPYTLHSGRPALETLIWNLLDQAEGETGIAVCGPLGLSARCRMSVARISEERGTHKGTGAQGVYLHVEGFGW